MRSIKLLLILLACSIPARAVDSNFCQAHATNCNFSVASTNGTILVGTSTSANTTTVPTDSAGNTYLPLATAVGGGTSCYTTTNSFGVTLLLCWFYTHNGSHTGSDTITGNASTANIWARFSPSSDVVNSGNPLDKSCTVTNTVAIGGSSATGCSIQSTQTNDIFAYVTEQDISGSCAFGQPSAATAGPSVTVKASQSCLVSFQNYDANGNIQNSGAPTTVTVTYGTTNTSGSAMNFNAFEVTLKSGVSAAGAQSYVQIIKYKMRKWKRKCERIVYL